jgi:hypothetical protein
VDAAPAISAENRRRESMTIDNRSPEIPAVCAEQIGIALALFRAAVLDQTAEEAILPLAEEAILPFSDQGIRVALLEPDAMQRGLGVTRTHLESRDRIHPVVQRVICFLQLLREQNHNPHPLWKPTVRDHNRFLPIVNAIAWCLAYKDTAFDVVIFARIARMAS